jgi:alpha-mannosidase
MGLNDHPEAAYLLFPFNIPGATARFDLGGQAVVPGEEQLPGVCRDYFTAQGWVDFSNGERGMTIALPENPMIQLGDFHFGDYQATFRLERPLLLGWVTNNYWETNFRAHQPGRVQARYRLYPYAGAFDEGQAHRRGLEAAHFDLVVQPLGEPAVQPPTLPASGSLLRLPEPPVLCLHTKPAKNGQGWIIRLLNASDQPQTAQLGSALLKIKAARRCGLFEEPVEELVVNKETVSVEIPARRLAVVHLEVALAE